MFSTNRLILLPAELLLHVISFLTPIQCLLLTDVYPELTEFINQTSNNRTLLRQWYYEPDLLIDPNSHEEAIIENAASKHIIPVDSANLKPKAETSFLSLAAQERTWCSYCGLGNDFELTLIRLHAHRGICRLSSSWRFDFKNRLKWKLYQVIPEFCARFQTRLINAEFLDRAVATAEALIPSGVTINFIEIGHPKNLVLYLDQVELAIRTKFPFDNIDSEFRAYACINLTLYLLEQKLTTRTTPEAIAAFNRLVRICFYSYHYPIPTAQVIEIRPSFPVDNANYHMKVIDWLIIRRLKIEVWTPDNEAWVLDEFHDYLPKLGYVKILAILTEPELAMLRWFQIDIWDKLQILDLIPNWGLWLKCFNYYNAHPMLELNQALKLSSLKVMIASFVKHPLIQNAFEGFISAKNAPSDVLEDSGQSLFYQLDQDTVGTMILIAALHALPFTNRSELADTYTRLGKKHLAWVTRSFNPRNRRVPLNEIGRYTI